MRLAAVPVRWQVAALLVWCLVAVGPARAQQAPPANLRVAAAGHAPFVGAGAGTAASSKPEGISVAVWEAVARRAGLTYAIRSSGSVKEALGLLRSGEVDVVVGPLTVTAERARDVLFTQPYYQSGLSIAARPRASTSQLLTPFLAERFLRIAGIVFAFLLCLGALTWLAERRHNSAQFPTDPVPGIANGLWFAITTMTTVGYGDRVPKTVLGRLLASLAMVASLVLLSSLAASMATAVALASLDEAAIAQAHQLRGVRVAYPDGTTARDFVARHGAKAVPVRDVEEALALLGRGEVQAVVFDRPLLRFALMNDSKLDVTLSDGEYDPAGYAFALRPQLPVAGQINIALLELQERGDVRAITSRWLPSP